MKDTNNTNTWKLDIFQLSQMPQKRISLLIEKGICDRQNISSFHVFVLCVSFIWRSLHFLVFILLSVLSTKLEIHYTDDIFSKFIFYFPYTFLYTSNNTIAWQPYEGQCLPNTPSNVIGQMNDQLVSIGRNTWSVQWAFLIGYSYQT